MTKPDALRRQGLGFSLAALLLLVWVAASPVSDSSGLTVVLATLIFVLGIPHGALDVVFAKRIFRLVSWWQWAAFVIAYVALAAAVVGFWWAFPAAFLTVFLAVSAFHFSGDLDRGTSVVLRFWYAGSMLIFPAWLYQAEVADLFAALVGSPFAAQLASLLHGAAVPWCAGLVATLAWQWRANWVTGVEVTAVGLLAITAPPLVSFTVFFCLMHSARHALRTKAFATDLVWTDLVMKALAPMAVCALATVLLWPTVKGLSFDTAIVRILFVALAALTVPHMVLIERVRLGGWQTHKPQGE